MMNVYNGNIVTNRAWASDRDFARLLRSPQRDFRYQLTVIGQFAQAIVAKEIGNRFTIRTSSPK